MKLLARITPIQIFVIIALVYLLGYFGHALYLGKTVYGDGTYYYAWLAGEASKFSVGPALFWIPVYYVTHNQIVVGATSVLATIFALILLWTLLLKKFSKTVSIMAIASVAGASNLLFYGSLDAVNSHALTFFAATVFLALLFQKRKNWLLIGAALGVLGLMRAQDLLYGTLLFPYLKKNTVLKIMSGLIIAFVPQLVAWRLVSGYFWTSPYLLHERFDLLHPHILGVLFNVHSGLFLWTPIVLMGVVGLVMSKRRLMLLVFLAELYAVASWSTWWQGASYSGRMFMSSLPILSFGIASVFAWLAKYRFTQVYFLLAIILPLTMINATSIIYFLYTLR